MLDVGAQLRQYFESTVERIDAEDVLAGARVTNQSERWEVRARRPLRAAVASAALVTAAISAVVAGAWMLGQTGSRIAETGPAPPATQPVATGGWPIALIAGGAVLAMTATLVGRKKRRPFASILTTRRRKGGSMETLERQAPEVRIEHLQKSNRGLIIALVVALLALAGLGTWLLFDRVIETGIEADINALLDELFANTNSGDFEANTVLFASTGVYIEGDGSVYRADEVPDLFADLESTVGEFSYAQLADPVIIQDPDNNRYYVAVPGQIGLGVDPFYNHFLTFVLSETTEGNLQIISQMVSPRDRHR